MNWGKIAKYAAALFVVQVVLGFFEGFFLPAETSESVLASVASLIRGPLASFVASAALFAHLSAHQPFRPFAHAWLALLLQGAAATLLWLALAGWLGDAPPLLILIEWLVLACALLAGTAIGSNLRRRRGESADA